MAVCLTNLDQEILHDKTRLKIQNLVLTLIYFVINDAYIFSYGVVHSRWKLSRTFETSKPTMEAYMHMQLELHT